MKQLETVSQSVGKYVLQLEVLSKLRNLQEETTKEITAMPFTYDLKTDIRYKQGVEEGIEKTKRDIATTLLSEGAMNPTQISAITGVPLAEVRKMKAAIEKTK
ncbi:MAG: hypothetical protein V4722_14640 [Bacteroidota bacterium]